MNTYLISLLLICVNPAFSDVVLRDASTPAQNRAANV